MFDHVIINSIRGHVLCACNKVKIPLTKAGNSGVAITADGKIHGYDDCSYEISLENVEAISLGTEES